MSVIVEHQRKAKSPWIWISRIERPFVKQLERILMEPSQIHNLGIVTPGPMPDYPNEQTIQLLEETRVNCGTESNEQTPASWPCSPRIFLGPSEMISQEVELDGQRPGAGRSTKCRAKSIFYLVGSSIVVASTSNCGKPAGTSTD